VYAIDPATNQLAATIDIGRFPKDISISDGKVWVASDVQALVWRIDPDSFRVVEIIGLNRPGGFIEATPSEVWVSGGGGVQMIDLTTGTVHDVLIESCHDLAIGEEFVWVTQYHERQVLKIDRVTREVVGTTKLESIPKAIKYGHEMVWVILDVREGVVGIEPETGEITYSNAWRSYTHGLAIAPDRVWFTSGNLFAYYNPYHRSSESLRIENYTPYIAYYAGSLWGVNPEEGQVIRLDLEDLSVQAVIPIGTDLLHIAGGG
jgi:hypothetical protein